MSDRKQFLKRIFPPSAATLQGDMTRVMAALDKLAVQEEKNVSRTAELARALSDARTAELARALSDARNAVQQLSEQLRIVREENRAMHDAIADGRRILVPMDEMLAGAVSNQQKQLALLAKIDIETQAASRHASEAVWAEIFNSTIAHSAWLKNRAFSPGRWAVGYPYLYVMYRVLNETHPKRILDLGLGQSTRMIAQYAAAHEGVEHIVVEHDQEWIDFFQNGLQLSGRSRMMKLDREMVPYKEAESVRVFKNFKETFAGQKFDFISIDAPLGADMKEYSRIDVLSLLPDCLQASFVLMMDDCERPGETRTMADLEAVFRQNGLPYARGKFSGDKDVAVISSKNLKFICSI